MMKEQFIQFLKDRDILDKFISKLIGIDLDAYLDSIANVEEYITNLPFKDDDPSYETEFWDEVDFEWSEIVSDATYED